VPSCAGNVCDVGDGCGGTCTCVAPNTCGGGTPGTPGVCGCTPDCAGKGDGADDKCGGVCTCTQASCGNGCCTQDGVCLRHAEQSVAACGTGGDTCGSCSTSETCRIPTCVGGSCASALSDDNAPGQGCAEPDVCCQGNCCTDGTTCGSGGSCVCPASAPYDCNQDGICQECCADGDCSGTDYCENNECTTCHPTPLLCDRNEQCCDFYNGAGDCSGPGIAGTKNCCRFFGQSSLTGSDCCSLFCSHFTVFPNLCFCLPGSASCTNDRNCCSGRCENGTCACDLPGTVCEPGIVGDSACCSKTCRPSGQCL
jgi:hypothetical protein